MYRLAAFADEADKTLDGQIKALKENGIDMLEIRGVNGKNISDLNISEAKEIKERLDDAGISVWSVGSPIGKYEIADDFLPELDRFRRTAELTDILGAGRMRIFSFYHTGLPVTGTLKDSVCERLSRFIGETEGTDLILCHENEKGIYGDTGIRCAEIHRSFLPFAPFSILPIL